MKVGLVVYIAPDTLFRLGFIFLIAWLLFNKSTIMIKEVDKENILLHSKI